MGNKEDDAIHFNRNSEFWFSRRQPQWQDKFVKEYGEWWDDTLFSKEEESDDIE